MVSKFRHPELPPPKAPSFTCSGPGLNPRLLSRHRAAQQRAFSILKEIGYPISMGLTYEADKLAKELRECIKLMASTTRR